MRINVFTYKHTRTHIGALSHTDGRTYAYIHAQNKTINIKENSTSNLVHRNKNNIVKKNTKKENGEIIVNTHAVYSGEEILSFQILNNLSRVVSQTTNSSVRF